MLAYASVGILLVLALSLSRSCIFFDNVNCLFEEFFNIFGCFSRYFEVRHAQLSSFLSRFERRNFPRKVNFVAKHNYCWIMRTIVIENLQPALYILKGCWICDIVYKNRAASVLQVGRDQRLKPLLASCIPQLEPVVHLPVVHILREEVNSHRGLRLTSGYIVSFIEAALHKPLDDWWFADCHVAQEHHLVLGFGRKRTVLEGWVHTLRILSHKLIMNIQDDVWWTLCWFWWWD